MYVPKNFFQKYSQSGVKRSKYTFPKTYFRNTFRVVSDNQNVRTQNFFQKYYQSSVKRSKCTYPKTSFINIIRVVSNDQNVRT